MVRVPARIPAGGPAAHTTRTSWYEWYEFALSSGIVVEKLVPVLVRVWSAGGWWYELSPGQSGRRANLVDIV